MPNYAFKCKACEHATLLFALMADCPPQEIDCGVCGCEKGLKRDYQEELSKVKAFQPYMEENFDGKLVDVTSPGQRDKLCKKYGLTYDGMHRSQAHAPVPQEVVTDQMIKDVLEETQGGKILPDDVKKACEAATDSD